MNGAGWRMNILFWWRVGGICEMSTSYDWRMICVCVTFGWHAATDSCLDVAWVALVYNMKGTRVLLVSGMGRAYENLL